MNVNLRPYYAEGSKTLAFEVAEQLGFELPDRVVCPVASGSLFTKIARGFEEWLELGHPGGLAARLQRRAGRGLQPGRPGLRGRARDLPARCGRTRSPSRSRSATRPTACSRSTSRAGPAARSTSVTDEEIVDGIRLLAETTGIFTETAGGVTTAVLAKLAERGDIGADDRVVLYITGEGLKTLDAVREHRLHLRRRADARQLRRDGAGGRRGARCRWP